MIPWKELGRARVGDGELVLSQRGEEFAIRMRGAELMNSRQHASEESLARLCCDGLGAIANARVLVGGLGMGFTLRAALDALAPTAHVDVVELVPGVVEWNRTTLGHLAGEPLADPRVKVTVGDVAAAIRTTREPWHAIMLDVDNGPDAFTSPTNSALYGLKGLMAARKALVPGGVYGVWSVENDPKFTGRLEGAGFKVDRHRVPVRPNSTVKHVIWRASAPTRAGSRT